MEPGRQERRLRHAWEVSLVSIRHPAAAPTQCRSLRPRPLQPPHSLLETWFSPAAPHFRWSARLESSRVRLQECEAQKREAHNAEVDARSTWTADRGFAARCGGAGPRAGRILPLQVADLRRG